MRWRGRLGGGACEQRRGGRPRRARGALPQARPAARRRRGGRSPCARGRLDPRRHAARGVKERIPGAAGLPLHALAARRGAPGCGRAGGRSRAGGASAQRGGALDAQVRELFAELGTLVVLDDALVDVATGLMSCAPAYVALIAEAQIDAGVRRGIPAAEGAQLVVQTLAGTAELLRRRGYDTLARAPRGLLARGASPPAGRRPGARRGARGVQRCPRRGARTRRRARRRSRD